jgi:subtilisin family serine protease
VNVSATMRPSPPLLDELRALQLSGALVVAAAGNEGISPGRATFPASQPHVLAVAALDRPTHVADVSTRAVFVDLAAPALGLGVVASSELSPDAETTRTPVGTSFAAPLVTGAAALVWSKHPTWTAGQVSDALRRSARPLGRGRPNPAAGWGRLDVARALQARPSLDPLEPNDWKGALDTLAPLLSRGRRSASLSARIDVSDDPVDLYRVELAAGGRLRVHIASDGPKLDVRLVRPARLAHTLATAPRAGGLDRRTSQAGAYVLVVRAAAGRGAYRVALTTS